MVARRRLMAAVVACAVAPPWRRASAQPTGRARTIGVLAPHLLNPNIRAFYAAMRDLGWDEGRVRYVVKSADAKLARLPSLAAALVAERPDVIVAINTPGVRAALDAAPDVPIVMVNVADPVATGFVATLARPGGRVTGVSNLGVELAAKRFQVVRDLLPSARRLAVLFNPDDPVTVPQVRDAESLAQRVGMEPRLFRVSTSAALVAAFEQAAAWPADVAMWLIGQQSAFIPRTNELSLKHRLPTMVVSTPEVERGGLIAYFSETAEGYRRAATFVDRILNGVKPGELPVEQPTKFELAINLRTAKALGLAVPQSLLLRADRIVD
jgi:putative ABC transport system substrate-binding protein